MKFCEKCGAQIPDEAFVCPQCQTPINNHVQRDINQQISKNKNSIKMYLIIPIIVILTATIVFGITYFVLSHDFKDAASTDAKTLETKSSETIEDTVFSAIDTTCPEQEYGNHDWRAATCVEPAKCYNCGAYKDDKLGNHSWWENLYDIKECQYCSMLYDDYIKENTPSEE